MLPAQSFQPTAPPNTLPTFQEAVIYDASGQAIPVSLAVADLRGRRAIFLEDLRELKRLAQEKLEAERRAALEDEGFLVGTAPTASKPSQWPAAIPRSDFPRPGHTQTLRRPLLSRAPQRQDPRPRPPPHRHRPLRGLAPPPPSAPPTASARRLVRQTSRSPAAPRRYSHIARSPPHTPPRLISSLSPSGNASLSMERSQWRSRVSRRPCPRHADRYPCTCAMGNVYRFVEPVVLLLLKMKGRSYGYDLAAALQDYALTDAEIERGALYRTLRRLEINGNVTSEWELTDSGPARRVYRLTPEGEKHLEEWTLVLDHLAKSMTRFVRAARSLEPRKSSARPRSA